MRRFSISLTNAGKRYTVKIGIHHDRKESGSMGARIKDIAKLAQVSSATVSLVLNDKPGVGEETRARIRRIAKELDYQAPKAQEPVAAPVIHVAPQVAQVEGVSSMTRWSAEVTDLMELVKYVAAHPEWLSLLEPAMPNLNRLAVAQRQALSIPGVRAISRTVRATR